MENTGSILASLFKNAGMGEKLTLARLQAEWADRFDEPLSLHTFPSSLNKGLLVVNVDSPLWMQQLKFFKQAMLKKLDSYGINAIDFRQGRANPSSFNRVRRHSEEEIVHEKKISAEDAEWIEQTLSLSNVSDPELKERIKTVLEKALMRNP
ncbi:MAG: DUF721 domain-containing protein [Nitrospirae bacterium]|nr:DUF721 domain-containing protein [Nitrospirota bacterium]